MCCKGKEIPYKDYTPQDQLQTRQAYNKSVVNPQTGRLNQATPYGLNNPFMAQMNPLQAMAMQAMFAQGGGQGQIQLPGYATWGQVSGQGAAPMQQPGMGGMPAGQFGGMRPGQGMQPNQQQIPFWLMMPGMGGGQRSGPTGGFNV